MCFLRLDLSLEFSQSSKESKAQILTESGVGLQPFEVVTGMKGACKRQRQADFRRRDSKDNTLTHSPTVSTGSCDGTHAFCLF